MILFINGPFGVGKTSVARVTGICTDERTPVDVADQILKKLAVQTG